MKTDCSRTFITFFPLFLSWFSGNCVFLQKESSNLNTPAYETLYG